MLSFLFPSSRQVTTSFGALNAASVGLSSGAANGDSIGSSLDQLDKFSSRTLCLVLGDGRDPRTAVVASIRYGWSVVAIDEELDEKWQHPRGLLPDRCRFMGYRGAMSGFLSQGYEMVQSSLCCISDIDHLVIICIEQGGGFDQLKTIRGRLGVTDLRVLYNNVPATVVSLSSDEIIQDSPLKSPSHSFVDEDILSTNKRVQVFSFQGSRRHPTTVSSVVSPVRIPHMKQQRPRIMAEESTKRESPLPSAPNRRGANGNSKVAQLQKQQELASRRRTEISAGQGRMHTRKPSATITDDTSLSSSKCKDKPLEASSSKPPRSSVKTSLSNMVLRRRATLGPVKRPNSIDSGGRRWTEGDEADSSKGGVLQTESNDTIMSLLSLHSPCPSRDVVIDVVSPSCMPRSASERHARMHDDPLDDVRTMKKHVFQSESSTSLTTESTANSSSHDDVFNQRNDSGSSIAAQEFKSGDFVEVRVGNVYQPGIIDKQLFKGVYNVTLYGDTPAWNEKRSQVGIYQQSPERIPEVLARDIRPFTPAPLGEVVFVFINGNERKCCVHGYSYSNSEELTAKTMKYVVKFAKKDGDEWRNEKHRVPVQRAYRMLCAL
jgi:hypothetical protein